LAGFAPVTRAITLPIGADATVNITLGVAALSESLTVIGESPLIEVTRSQPASVVGAQQLQTLPVLDRNFMALAQLLPGTGAYSGSKFAVTKFGGVADQRNGYTTIIDGGNVDDAIWGNTTINMTQDAVQEFKVFRHQFDAQYGQALDAVVTVITKSGSNLFSGSAFYFGRDKALNAQNAKATSKPPYNQARIGGSFGGPIVKNQTHFFSAYERLKVNSALIRALSPSNPFAELENGNFPTNTVNNLVDGRVDHRFSDTQSISVRYAMDNNQVNGAKIPVKVVDGLRLGTDSPTDYSKSHSVVAEHNWMKSSSMVNTLRTHILKHTVATLANNTEMGITRPSFTWGQGSIAPQIFPRTEVSFNDTLYINTPRHDIRFGGDYTWGTFGFDAHFNERGRFSFSTDARFDPNNSATWPFQFVMEEPGFFRFKSQHIAVYAQDDWRMVDRLRLNLGLRYDLETNLRHQEFYDSLLSNPTFAGIEQFISHNRGNDYNNLQPRVGATWDVRGNGTLVARGGWGLYVTRNRPWFQLANQQTTLGNAIQINDPQQLRLFSDINAVLGGRSLGEVAASGGVRRVYLLADDNELPEQLSTSAGIGWQLNASTSLDVDFIHAYARKQLGGVDPNLPPSGPISATNPRPVRQLGQVRVIDNTTKTWYDALETQLRTRVRGANSLQISYTLAKSIMDGPESFGTFFGTQRTPQEKGYHRNDTRHNLTISASTQLPGQFQVSGILRATSGSPFAVNAGLDLDGDASPTGDRPRGLPPTVGRRNVEHDLEVINAFRASRNLPPIDASLLKLEPNITFEMRMTKALALRDGHRLELFLEAYNLTNYASLGGVSGNMSSRAFLERTTASPARQIQWGARYMF